MNTVKFTGKKPKMIAHRGVSGIECENTCPAFVLAGGKSYFGIETDLHLSKDGQYFICHDCDLARVAGGVHIVIEESNYEKLRKVPLCSPNHGDKRSDLFVPLLSDYIAICKKYGKRAILEIKTDFTLAQIEGMMKIIQAYEYFEGVTFISFYQNPLALIKEHYPTSACQFLTGDATAETLAFLDEHHIDLDIYHGSLSREYVDEVHAHGHEVNTWTVDDLDRAIELTEMGVDYITSNILE